MAPQPLLMSERFSLFFSGITFSLPVWGLLTLPFLALYWFWKKPKGFDVDVPLLTNESEDFMEILQEGYTKHPRSLFKIPTSNKPMVIVPTHMLDDLKAYPEEAISFRKEMSDRFLGRYTSVASNSEAMIQSVKSNLTRGLDSVIPIMQEEVKYALEECIGNNTVDAEGWVKAPLYALSVRIIAFVSSRVFVGLPLSRNQEWIDMAINSTFDSFVGAAMMYKYPSWSWPIMRFFVPQTKRIQQCRRRVGEMLKPILRERMDRAKNNPGSKKPSDMIQWLIDNSNGRGEDLPFQANEHIVMNVAATHTTGGQLAHTLCALAQHPEYIPILREELQEALKEIKPGESLNKKTLFQLKKMDSFMREVQRMNPPGMVSANRKALEPIKLSNGVIVPTGTSLATLPVCVSMDPKIWKNPNEFDGLRFYNLRLAEGEEKYQFVSVNEEALSFGHGRHACPGRFYAAAELKVVLAEILSTYDIKLCEGYSKTRPLGAWMEIMAAPDHTYELCFRKRAAAAA